MSDEIIASFIGAGATIIAGVIVYILSRNYYKHTKKIEQDRMMKELFTEFNQRYDRINNKIDKISKLSSDRWKKLKPKKKERYKGVIIDFFNICAEEYHWHSEGRINGKIWASWCKGMNDIFNKSEVIQDIWEKECENEGYRSYYISKKNEIFKKG
ncbi:hypothetical protein DHD32_10150 [Arenibacter sp. TNZ]|uniref:hypothetical protein n=1 Tax=Arenibacter TaxID=178469 RepID=UPI000CD3ECAD|nr:MULTISPECIES: hypothetical protein [Arenibacter]MCM4171844.1 hypothetical protein [Arenibacter sp. TNZ]